MFAKRLLLLGLLATSACMDGGIYYERFPPVQPRYVVSSGARSVIIRQYSGSAWRDCVCEQQGNIWSDGIFQAVSSRITSCDAWQYPPVFYPGPAFIPVPVWVGPGVYNHPHYGRHYYHSPWHYHHR